MAIRPGSPIQPWHPLYHNLKTSGFRQRTTISAENAQTVLPSTWDVDWNRSYSSLILACSRIYKETSPYMYSEPTFYFEDGKGFKRFVGQVGPKNCANIRKIEMLYMQHGRSLDNGQRLSLEDWEATFGQIAASFSGLKGFKITIFAAEPSITFANIPNEQRIPRIRQLWTSPLKSLVKHSMAEALISTVLSSRRCSIRPQQIQLFNTLLSGKDFTPAQDLVPIVRYAEVSGVILCLMQNAHDCAIEGAHIAMERCLQDGLLGKDEVLAIKDFCTELDGYQGFFQDPIAYTLRLNDLPADFPTGPWVWSGSHDF